MSMIWNWFMSKCVRYILSIVVLLVSVHDVQGQERFKRGLEMTSFVPKGQWVAGMSVSYAQSSQDNYQFLIIEDLSGESYTFKVSPMVCYIFKDNLGVGGKFAYTRTLNKLEHGSVILSTDTKYDLDHLYSLAHNYYGMAIFRNYISLGNSKRFGVFNEVQLQLGGGQSKLVNGSGDALTGTYERNYSVDVGLAPGLIMFLNNYSALEVNVGVLGFSYTRTKSVTDQIYVAHRDSRSANFKINLFSISFGVAFYL